MCQQRQRDMTVSTVPATHLILIEAMQFWWPQIPHTSISRRLRAALTASDGRPCFGVRRRGNTRARVSRRDCSAPVVLSEATLLGAELQAPQWSEGPLILALALCTDAGREATPSERRKGLRDPVGVGTHGSGALPPQRYVLRDSQHDWLLARLKPQPQETVLSIHLITGNPAAGYPTSSARSSIRRAGWPGCKSHGVGHARRHAATTIIDRALRHVQFPSINALLPLPA
jgi:hypothetical protein